MLLQERIESFIRLGHVLRDFCNRENGKDSNPATSHKLMDSLRQAAANAQLENPWFTKENILFAMQSIALNLNRDDLESWLKPYLTDLEKNSDARTVAVIMAGNIPMVGFHDFLCVLMSGNRFLGKLSSDDKLLLPAMTGILIEFNPGWDAYISFTQDPIRSFDAVIATGSNSSSGYFEYYFSRYPHIIRKNRNSIAILTGKESAKELSSLAMDIFLYFGLGCRSVSKVYVPENYDFSLLAEAFTGYCHLLDHNKYRNNYDYFKAIFQLNLVPFIDGRSILLREDTAVSSPISVLNYNYYNDWDELLNELFSMDESIQCIISEKEVPSRWFKPGNSQSPGLPDYADGVDTMLFLVGMK